MKETQRSQERDADLVGAALKHHGRTLAVAESLTGGLLASAFARASGSSEWFRGGIVAYSSAVKSGSPESICEQVCTETVRMLRERLELAAARPRPG